MRNARILVGIAFTLIFLFLAFRNIDLAAVSGAMLSADPSLLICASAVYMSTFMVRGLRWTWLSGRIKSTLRRSAGYVIIGWMGNNVLPARGGEILRAYVTGKEERAEKSFVLGTIVTERFFDIAALASILVVLSIASALPGWIVTMEVAVVSAMLLFGAVLFTGRMLTGKGKDSGVIRKKLSSFVSGAGSVGGKRTLPVFVSSLVIWSLEGCVFLLTGMSMGIGLGFAEFLFVLVVVNIGIALPSSPGYVGTFQFFAVLALSVFGVASPVAAAFAILVHLVIYVPVTLAGIALMTVKNIGIRGHGGRSGN